MISFGIIGLIVGIVCAIYGNSLNKNLAVQLENFFKNGTINTEDTLLYTGIAIAAVGLILLTVGLFKKNSK